ncbi:MAG TPA: hypothetical protein VGC41_10025, partial [Kofleriaceae bacterium]
MKLRAAAIASIVLALFVGRARADEEDHPPEAAEHHEEAPAEHHEEAPPEHHEEAPAEHHEEASAHEAAPAEHHEEASDHGPAPGDEDADPEDAHYSKFDLDGDGHDDPALEKEYDTAFEGIGDTIDPDAVDKELDARPKDAELVPSITIEQFRRIVGVVRKVVLDRMEKKIARSSAKKMAQFSAGIGVFSLCGLFLLLIPLFYAKRYPGNGGTLLKYS